MQAWQVTTVAALFVAALPAQRRGGQDRGAVWEHLRKTYDKDGDGKITLEEYGRGEKPFGNLDRNRDKTITKADFEGRRRGGRRRGGNAPDRRAMLARSLGDMFGSFLNTDGKPGIDKAEWARIVASLKPDQDGVIANENLGNLLGDAGRGRMARFIGNRLPRTFDTDQDGTITTKDMDALFALLDANGDGNIEQGKEIDMPPGVGEWAPDFTLPYAKNKDETVTLKDYRGKKPVALIFGSYT